MQTISALLCLLTAFALGTVAHAAPADTPAAAPAPKPAKPGEVVFVYDDIDAFARAHARIKESRATTLEAMQAYVAEGSAAFKFFADRYGVTPEAMASAVEARPRYYARLAGLKARLQSHEPVIRAAIAKLTSTAPAGSSPVPVYYLIAHQTAGGAPVQLAPGEFGVAVAIDLVSMAPDVDLSEFPKGIGGRQKLSDIPQVVVHETAHVYQARSVGLDNYRSIYTDPARRTNLAIALREGCAEELTYLALGSQLGDRHIYGEAHEKELWREFKQVIDKPGFSSPGWFDAAGSNPAHPDWPMQIGYWLGMSICRTYLRAAPDSDAAMEDVYRAYLPAHFAKILAPYAARAE